MGEKFPVTLFSFHPWSWLFHFCKNSLYDWVYYLCPIVLIFRSAPLIFVVALISIRSNSAYHVGTKHAVGIEDNPT